MAHFYCDFTVFKSTNLTVVEIFIFIAALIQSIHSTFQVHSTAFS